MLNLNRRDHATQAAYALACRVGGEPLTPIERQVIAVVHREPDGQPAPEVPGSPHARARFMALRLRADPHMPRTTVLSVQHFPLEDRARVQVLDMENLDCKLTVEPGARPAVVRSGHAADLQGPQGDGDIWDLTDGGDEAIAGELDRELQDWVAARPRTPLPRYALDPSFRREVFDVAWQRAWEAADPRPDRPPEGAVPALMPYAAQTLRDDLGFDPLTAMTWAPGVAVEAVGLNRVQESSLPLSAQERIGVARFPSTIRPREFMPDADYGISFCRQTHVLAARLRQGELQSFGELWGACRDWRAARAIGALADQPSAHSVIGSFEIDRQGLARTLMTPISGRYAYVADRLIGAAGTQVGTVHEPVTLGGKRARLELQLHQRVARLDVGDGPPVELTRLKVWTQGDGSPPPQVPGYPRLLPGTRGVMVHPPPAELTRVLPEAERRVAAILASTDRSPQALLPELGRLHWLLAQMAPDARGSAAKTELAVRALALAHGWELAPFSDGFVPDLEAFLCDEDVFARGYADAFVSPAQAVMPVAG